MATSLNSDGTVGVTKGIPTFKVTGPGMMINDNRIVIGEARNSRFRMCKAWSMGALQEAKILQAASLAPRKAMASSTW
ncbi:hypothetical protein LP416_27870 [Polaromonas sp. P2-4]|nr:hypothetical protein LP416_27870 [Polaromonas sp. P2-4]